MALVAKLILMATACSIGLSACGNKGGLSTPAQIESKKNKKESK